MAYDSELNDDKPLSPAQDDNLQDTQHHHNRQTNRTGFSLQDTVIDNRATNRSGFAFQENAAGNRRMNRSGSVFQQPLDYEAVQKDQAVEESIVKQHENVS